MGARSRRTRTRGTRGGNREPDLGITPEEFHAARQERAGTQIVLTERVTREVAPLIVPSRLEDSIERTRHAYSNPETITGELAAAGVINPKRYMQMNLWWAQEWLRPDSPYHVRVLTPIGAARGVLIVLAGDRLAGFPPVRSCADRRGQRRSNP